MLMYVWHVHKLITLTQAQVPANHAHLAVQFAQVVPPVPPV